MLKNKIKTLIDLIEGTEIQEIEVSSFWGAQKIKLNKGSTVKSETIVKNDTDSSTVVVEDKVKNKISNQEEKSNPIKVDVESEKQETKVEDVETVQNFHSLKAPLVGTYYSSPKPDDPPFVNVGDKVTKGQTLCIIEAMKIFNEIESDIDGVIMEICVENGNPVEFDQLILKIKPE